ncbi:hypothetical protein ABH922_000135 [Rhodococcus sp. 27YEA15]|uniref:hypothetical protein n=1 Tax=Rhodococcus sp. 27YEA15 TaxID=3156259 RepID=UPI003C7D3D6E
MANEVLSEIRRKISDEKYYPYWPQSIRYPFIFVFLCFVALSILALRALVRDGLHENHTVVISTVLILVAVAGGSAALWSAGFRYFGLSKRIAATRSTKYGSGVVIPANRAVDAMIALLVLVGVYGLTSAYLHYTSASMSLLPFGRDTSSGANYMAVLGSLACALAILFLAFRSNTDYRLYSDGMERNVRAGRLSVMKGRKSFIRWESIDLVLTQRSIGYSGVETRNNQMKITTTSDIIHSRMMKRESLTEITVQVSLLPVEPNALTSLIRYMKDHPEYRYMLGEPNARELLRPLPLRERFRRARQAKSSTGPGCRPTDQSERSTDV